MPTLVRNRKKQIGIRIPKRYEIAFYEFTISRGLSKSAATKQLIHLGVYYNKQAKGSSVRRERYKKYVDSMYRSEPVEGYFTVYSRIHPELVNSVREISKPYGFKKTISVSRLYAALICGGLVIEMPESIDPDDPWPNK